MNHRPILKRGSIAEFIDDHGGEMFILALYFQLRTVSKIRDLFEEVYKFNCSLSPIYKYIAKNNIQIDPAGKRKGRMGGGAIQKRVDENGGKSYLEGLYAEHGTAAGIARYLTDEKNFYCTPNSISHSMKRYGLKVGRRGRRCTQKLRIKEVKDENINQHI